MFDRKLYKEKGKQAFQRNYWLCVAAALIIVLLCDGLISTVFNANKVREYVPQIKEAVYYRVNNVYTPFDTVEFAEYTDENDTSFVEYSYAVPTGQPGGYAYTYTTAYRPSAPSALWTLLGIFVFNIINVGGRRFFMNNRVGSAKFSDLFAYFEGEHYLSHVWTEFAVHLQVILWSLLLIVPGIIKSYEYAMVPFIAADNPEMKKKEVFALSKQMMTGHKWDLFVFDLSFLGWNILSVLTADILGFLYVFPYKKAAMAEVYDALKNGLYAG